MNQEALAKRMMRRLCAFPSFRPDRNPDMEKAYAAAIVEMIDRFGVELTGCAITLAVRAGGQFPPSAYDLQLYIPAAEREKHQDDERDQMITEMKSLFCYYAFHTPNCAAAVAESECTCGFSKVVSQIVQESEESA